MKEIDAVMEMINGIISNANAELAEMTKDGFPFSFDEVELTCSSDSAGIYVHSGKIPVCPIARAGDPESVIFEIRSRIRDVVESTKTAIERRGSLKSEAEALQNDDEMQRKAIEALKAANVSTSVLGGGFSPDAAKAVSDAARKAVKTANRVSFIGVIPHKDFRMSVKEFGVGLVVVSCGKPVLVTRFPKTCNNATINRMCSFITGEIEAINECRCRYYEEVRRDMDREERLHEIAQRLDAADELLMAAAI